MSQALELMLSEVFVPNHAQNGICSIIDKYSLGTTALYSFDPPSTDTKITPIGGPGSPGCIIQKPGYLGEELKDIESLNGIAQMRFI